MVQGRPQGRGRGRGGQGAAGRNTTERGLFSDGQWHCDCTPRVPAERFQVKKESKNHGRFFFTCQRSPDERCGFFLWEDDAKPRMEAAVLAKSRTEPKALAQQETPVSLRRAFPRNPPPEADPTTPSKAARKRKLPWDEEGNEEEFDWPLTQEEEAILVETADPRTSAAPDQPTPRKLPRLENGLPTPDITPQKPRLQHAAGETRKDTTPGLDTPASASAHSADLPTEAFNLLSSHNIGLPPATSNALRSLLDKHSMRARGLEKSRDVARAGIKSRDSLIAKHTSRIEVLETDVESWKALSRSLRARNKGSQA